MVSCIRSETVKMLEEHFEEKLLDINLGNDIFDIKNKNSISKISNCDCIKLRSFCITKEAINKMKRQTMD